MTEAVLDASVIVKWFHSAGETELDAAHRLLATFRDGKLSVTVPPLLYLEIMNVAGRRWGWDRERLIELASALRDLEFAQHEPDLVAIAEWTAKGLTAYDAAYVALAEEEQMRLVTDDQRILALAPAIALALHALPIL